MCQRSSLNTIVKEEEVLQVMCEQNDRDKQREEGSPTTPKRPRDPAGSGLGDPETRRGQQRETRRPTTLPVRHRVPPPRGRTPPPARTLRQAVHGRVVQALTSLTPMTIVSGPLPPPQGVTARTLAEPPPIAI